MTDERTEAIQAVVDRVTSYQESATESTVEKELREAFAETDVDVSDDELARLVGAIEKADQPVDVAQVL
ncbi:hypothetical protein ABFT23_08570 [Nocardioides sp. C4-1]|uniref:hypothetical protein n=1 Tax=Nocardioides sp. C4-1 TaxID=3151851 RepID=UPI0032677389